MSSLLGGEGYRGTLNLDRIAIVTGAGTEVIPCSVSTVPEPVGSGDDYIVSKFNSFIPAIAQVTSINVSKLPNSCKTKLSISTP